VLIKTTEIKIEIITNNPERPFLTLKLVNKNTNKYNMKHKDKNIANKTSNLNTDVAPGISNNFIRGI
jgi:hypothetical protein